MSDLIAGLWVEFEKGALSPDAPSIQRTEMKRAFYAGVEALMKVAWEIGGDSISEQAGVNIMKAVQAELAEFAEQVAEGKA